MGEAETLGWRTCFVTGNTNNFLSTQTVQGTMAQALTSFSPLPLSLAPYSCDTFFPSGFYTSCKKLDGRMLPSPRVSETLTLSLGLQRKGGDIVKELLGVQRLLWEGLSR